MTEKTRKISAKAEQFIREFGPRKLIQAFPQDLRPTDSGVYAWVNHRNQPSYERAKVLVALSKTKPAWRKLRLKVDDFRLANQPETTEPANG